VKAVNGRAEVYLDGGVRTGTDVLKALALGARAVFVGRPPVYGLAVAVSTAGYKKNLLQDFNLKCLGYNFIIYYRFKKWFYNI